MLWRHWMSFFSKALLLAHSMLRLRISTMQAVFYCWTESSFTGLVWWFYTWVMADKKLEDRAPPLGGGVQTYNLSMSTSMRRSEELGVQLVRWYKGILLYIKALWHKQVWKDFPPQNLPFGWTDSGSSLRMAFLVIWPIGSIGKLCVLWKPWMLGFPKMMMYVYITVHE